MVEIEPRLEGNSHDSNASNRLVELPIIYDCDKKIADYAKDMLLEWQSLLWMDSICGCNLLIPLKAVFPQVSIIICDFLLIPESVNNCSWPFTASTVHLQFHWLIRGMAVSSSQNSHSVVWLAELWTRVPFISCSCPSTSYGALGQLHQLLPALIIHNQICLVLSPPSDSLDAVLCFHSINLLGTDHLSWMNKSRFSRILRWQERPRQLCLCSGGDRRHQEEDFEQRGC